jgi:hypothetical protein
LKNTGPDPVTLSYLTTSAGELQVISPPYTIGPGAELLVANAPRAIPPEGVTVIHPDVASLETSFYIPSDAEVVASANIQNLLPVDERPAIGPLLRVSLVLEFNMRNASEQVVRYPGPTLNLAPFGVDGDSADKKFVKPRAGPVGISVTGTAHFRDGEITLTAREFNNLNVKITRDMLPQ